MSSSNSGPLIIVCANQAWNLVNFRSDLIRALIAAGCRVTAVAPRDPAMELRLAELGAGFEPLAIDAKGLAPHRDFATFLSIHRLLKRLRPAAWLSWTIKPNVYGSLAAQLNSVTAIPNVSGLGTAFIRRNLLTQAAKALYRAGFRKAATVFFQNADDRDEFVHGKLVFADQARLLPGSGIDTERFSPPDGGRSNRQHFLMLSRVVADKGVREFVEAARKTRARWPDARFTLMGEIGAPNRTVIPAEEVAGWVEEGIIEHLEPVDDVRPHIATADFIVLPSYREGLSRVLVEAGAMGRPAITTDVPGCRDIVSDGVNGFLCQPQDAADLANAFARAAETDDQAWEVMAQAARCRVVTEFSAERVIALYLSALRDAGVQLPNDHT
ncbi:MAG: glycosyltransferase family 4 protein [Novosphingobium sp.]